MQSEGKRLTEQERPYSISINHLQSFLTLPMLSTIKRKIKLSIAPGYLFNEDVLGIIAHRMVNRIGDFSQNLIYLSLKERIVNCLKDGWFDHGLMGAIFLLQRFYSLIHSFFLDESSDKGNKDIDFSTKFLINRGILRFTDAITAVALHNIKTFKSGIFKPELKVKIKNQKLPLAFLLILCDELQTWEREMSPPGIHSKLSFLQSRREKRVDKNMFIDHFQTFYKKYSSAKWDNKKIIFYLPFRKDKDIKKEETKEGKEIESITYQITLTDDYQADSIKEYLKKNNFKIEFRICRLFLLSNIIKKMDKDSRDFKIKKKIYEEMEEKAWESFIDNHKTLGHFIDMVFGIEKLLSINSENGPDRDKNNVAVQSMDCLLDEILPPLKLLQKGQDKLSPYLKPYHFHDIPTPKKKNNDDADENKEDLTNKTDGEKKKDKAPKCILRLQYPGKEVDNIENVIKKRIEKKMYRAEHKKEVNLQYPEAPGFGLNRLINKYIPLLQEYLYDIQQGKFKIKKDFRRTK
jgi:hypothetical protein